MSMQTKIIDFYSKKIYKKYNFLINKENYIKSKPLKKDFYEGINKINKITKYFKNFIIIKSLITSILIIFLFKENKIMILTNIFFEILIYLIYACKAKTVLEIIKIKNLEKLRSTVTEFFKTIELEDFYSPYGSPYNGYKEIRLSRKSIKNENQKSYVNLIIDKESYLQINLTKEEEYIDFENLLKKCNTVEELIEKITNPTKRANLNDLIKEVEKKIANNKR